MTQSFDQGFPHKSAPDSSGTGLQMMISSDLLLRQMYESVTDFAIYTVDCGAYVTSWNAGALKIFGYGYNEVLGMNSAIMFTEEDRRNGEPEGEIHTAKRDGRAADFRWHLRKDGSRFWADGVMTPIRNEAGEIIGFLKILRDITERKMAEDEISRLARIDTLTGLYNRAAFDVRRKELTAAALRNGHKLLLFMIDLDRFKEINDTCGHHAGDQLLTEAVRTWRALSCSERPHRVAHLCSGSGQHLPGLADR